MTETHISSFDRILSIEVRGWVELHANFMSQHLRQMFEHMKNYKMLMAKVASWLRADTPDALFFVHIFCHRTTPYHFEAGDGWMAQMFFSGVSLSSQFTAAELTIAPCRIEQAELCPPTICWYVPPSL